MLWIAPFDGVVTVMIGVVVASVVFDAVVVKLGLVVSLPLCATFKVFLFFNP